MFDQSSFSLTKIKQIFGSCSKSDLFLLAIGILGFVVSVYGFSVLVVSRNNNLLVSASSGELILQSNETPPLVFEVSGAVAKPGMYALEHGARVGQALELAGNITNDADISFVDKQLNLAQAIRDGEKIYIPYFEQSKAISSESSEIGSSASGTASSEVSGKVSINQATQSQLMELSGVGEKRAESIIASRPYQSLDQLIEKEVLTEKLFAEIEQELSL